MKPSTALLSHRIALRELAARHRLGSPRVFGSVIHGTDRDDSDLDVLVEPTEQTTLFTLTRFAQEAEVLTGVRVDVVTPGSLPADIRDQVTLEAQAI